MEEKDTIARSVTANPDVETVLMIRAAEWLGTVIRARPARETALRLLRTIIHHAADGRAFALARRAHDAIGTQAQVRYAIERMRACGLIEAVPNTLGTTAVTYVFSPDFVGLSGGLNSEDAGLKSGLNGGLNTVSPRVIIPPEGGNNTGLTTVYSPSGLNAESSPSRPSGLNTNSSPSGLSPKRPVRQNAGSRIEADRETARRLLSRADGVIAPRVAKTNTREEREAITRRILAEVYPVERALPETLRARAEERLAELRAIPTPRLSGHAVRTYWRDAIPQPQMTETVRDNLEWTVAEEDHWTVIDDAEVEEWPECAADDVCVEEVAIDDPSWVSELRRRSALPVARQFERYRIPSPLGVGVAVKGDPRLRAALERASGLIQRKSA